MTADTADHVPTGPRTPADTMDVQGRLFTDLDRLAFALEMEVAESLRKGNPAEADRLQDQRLGVRLAQRLVSGVWADEVDLRLQRWNAEYDRRVGHEAIDEEGAPS